MLHFHWLNTAKFIVQLIVKKDGSFAFKYRWTEKNHCKEAIAKSLFSSDIDCYYLQLLVSLW